MDGSFSKNPARTPTTSILRRPAGTAKKRRRSRRLLLPRAGALVAVAVVAWQGYAFYRYAQFHDADAHSHATGDAGDGSSNGDDSGGPHGLRRALDDAALRAGMASIGGGIVGGIGASARENANLERAGEAKLGGQRRQQGQDINGGDFYPPLLKPSADLHHHGVHEQATSDASERRTAPLSSSVTTTQHTPKDDADSSSSWSADIRARAYRSQLNVDAVAEVDLQQQQFEETTPPAYGFVMRDFANRILSGRIFQGDVFVHAPDAEEAERRRRRRRPRGNGSGESGVPPEEATVGGRPFSVGARLLLHAADEGHTTYGVARGTPNEWWSSRNTPEEKRGSERRRRRMLLAVVDHPTGPRTSRILSQSSASTFLREAGPTYVLVGFTSYSNCTTPGQTSGAHAAVLALNEAGYRVQVLSASHFRPDINSGGAWRPNSVLDANGARSLMMFLVKGAQISAQEMVERKMGEWEEEEEHYAESQTGAGQGGGVVALERRRKTVRTQFESRYHRPVKVQAYIFATKRMDLAIPTQRMWLNTSTWGNARTNGILDVGGGLGGIPYMGCPPRHGRMGLEFVKATEKRQAVSSEPLDNLRILCDDLDVTDSVRADTSEDKEVDVWTSNNNCGGDDDARRAEAACVRLRCDRYLPEEPTSSKKKKKKKKTGQMPLMVACTSRVLPPPSIPPPPPPLSSLQQAKVVAMDDDDAGGGHGQQQRQQQPPNVLLIVLKSMSRQHSRITLPAMREALATTLDFVEFKNHVVVDGDAPESNLEALLVGGDAEGGEASNHGGSEPTTPGPGPGGLLDRLRDEAGYRHTLDAQDSCLASLPASEIERLWSSSSRSTADLKTVRRRRHLGGAFMDMLCFDFDYPNCVGRESAAGHLAKYAREFIDAFSSSSSSSSAPSNSWWGGGGGGGGDGGGSSPPWAAVLRFAEGDEDTMALSGTLDPVLTDFLRHLKTSDRLKDTAVVVTSDHGLDYGPYLQSPSGRREYHEPLLFVRLPDTGVASDRRTALETNAAMRGFTTHWDVRRTILDVAGLGSTAGRDEGVGVGGSSSSSGSSLLEALPTERSSCRGGMGGAVVPKEYCDLLEKFESQQSMAASSVAAAVASNNINNEDGVTPSSSTTTCESAPHPPPSLLSFYADVDKADRPRWPSCSQSSVSSFDASLKRKLSEGLCRCATSHDGWRDCRAFGNAAPRFGMKLSGKKDEGARTYMSMVDCEGEVLRYDAKIPRREDLVERSRAALVATTARTNHQTASGATDEVAEQPRRRPPPNILFLEIDSVSIPFADRHFPKTRELLARHRLRRGKGGRYECGDSDSDHSGLLCSAFFSNFGIVGPNSVSNQVAALGGCIVAPLGQDCEHKLRGDNKICPDPSYREYGLEFFKRGGAKKTVWCPPTTKTKTKVTPNAKAHESDDEDDAKAGTDKGSGSSSTWIYDVSKESGYVTFFGEEFCYPGSPWVIQGSIFEDNPDFAVHPAYCRLAEREARINPEVCGEDGEREEGGGAKNNGKKCADSYLLDLSGTPKAPLPCLNGTGANAGKRKQELAPELIESLWDAYPTEPKFAYLNAMAAHDYAIDWGSMALGAEAYDEVVSNFLDRMLSRDDAHNTVIVVRADHGLQGGPSIIDYSTQIEHRHPWTELVVPRDWQHEGVGVSVSLESLEANQRRLVTGFDLYRTLRSLMAPPPELRSEGGSLDRPDDPSSQQPPIPEWATDLLTSAVPPARTCHQARIPPDHCPCEYQRPDPAPRYGVCNLFEEGLDRFCPDWDEVRRRRCDPTVTPDHSTHCPVDRRKKEVA